MSIFARAALSGVVLLLATPAVHAQATVKGVPAIVKQWQRSLPAAGKRDTVVKRRGRADALSRMMALVTSRVAAERRAAIDALIGFSLAEPSRALEMYLVAALTRIEAALTRDQAARFAAARQRVFPLAPSVPKTGTIVVRQYVGDEFFKNQVTAYRRAGYTMSAVTAKSAVAKKGRVAIRVALGDKDIFRDMADASTHVVIYSGHSDIGGIVEQALTTAPAQKGQKLVVLLQCVGTQTLPMVAVKYEAAQILTTKNPSYDDLDINVALSLMESLHFNETYAQLRTRAKRGASIANYVFPDDASQAASWDLDRDGRLDLAAGQMWDKSFDVADLRKKPAGHTLISAVGYLNSAHHYYAEDTKNAVFKVKDALDRYVPGGINATSTTGIVAFKARTVGGKSVFEAALDGRYARVPYYTLAAAIVYEIHLHLVLATRGKVDARDHLRALFFVGDYLYRLVPYTNEAETAMAAFTKLKGLPAVTYAEVEKAIFSDMANSATDAQIDIVGRAVAAKRTSAGR